MMAVYAAMVECIDRGMGLLVEGLKQRGVLDNTLIVFISDNGGNAEGGPKGTTSGTGPIGGPQSYVLTGMNWATLNNTPFFPLQALHARRGHQLSLRRPIAPGNSRHA